MPTLVNFDSAFYNAAMPIFVLTFFIIIGILLGSFKRSTSPGSVFALCNAAFLATLAAQIYYSQPGDFLGGALVVGKLSVFMQVILLGAAWVLSVLTYFSHLRRNFFRPELISVYFFVVLGMMVFCASEDLVTLFVGLEISSIGLYTLVGYTKETRFSLEGGIKYLVLGSFATAMLLFGFAFLYACSGSLRLPEMVHALSAMTPHLWLVLGASFTIFALGFKLALVPFQQWSPDAYEAAATNITGFMTICVKVMILSLLLKVLSWSSESLGAYWVYLLGAMALASMLYGNIMALIQSSVKRMLAYSSIAHSGYMAIALSVMEHTNPFPAQALLFYLISYALTSLLVFGVLLALETSEGDNIQLQDLKGLAHKYPWRALAITTGMVSFAGLPPTMGFLGKFFVFNAAIKEGYFGLVLCAVVASLISLFYYLRVPVMMYMHAPTRFVLDQKGRMPLVPASILFCVLIGIIAAGTVLPGALFGVLKPLFGQ